MDEKELAEYVSECMKIIEENVDVLSEIDVEINQKSDEDEVTPNIKLHDLMDMVEDVSDSTKLRRAESNFMRRNFD